jgi:HEAT repeat protein
MTEGREESRRSPDYIASRLEIHDCDWSFAKSSQLLCFRGFFQPPLADPVVVVGMNGHVRWRILIFLATGLCLAAGGGCRMFVEGFGSLRASPTDERESAGARALEVDLWRPNTNWSPLFEMVQVPISVPDAALERWSHPYLSTALAAAAQEGLISAEASRAAATPSAVQRSLPDPAVNAWFAELSKHNDLAGWNGAILWAHYDPRAAREATSILARLVEHPPTYVPAQRPASEPNTPFGRNPGQAGPKVSDKPAAGVPIVVSPNFQCAAAEAWCLVLAAAPGEPENALAPAGRALAAGTLPSKVQDELLLGIARRVRPARIPQLVRALNHSDPGSLRAVETRRAAADACLVFAVAQRVTGQALEYPEAELNEAFASDDAEGLAAALPEDSPWPPAFWQFRNDPDPRLRRRLGELAAVIRHPAADALLKGQLRDVDQHVREAAILSLGVLGTEAARHELSEQVKRTEERPRELAMRGLACGGPAAVKPFTQDKSAKVRAEVARCVRRQPGAAAAHVLRDLMTDPSLEVQEACLGALHEWPDSLATPLLLEALAGSAFKTRQAALKQLEIIRGGGLSFPLYAGPQERALRVQQWTSEWNIPDANLERVRELAREGSPQLDEARLADLRERLNWPSGEINQASAQFTDWAGELSASDVPLLEKLFDEASPVQIDVLLHQILPGLSPTYAALVRLEDADARIRRDAASEIGRIGTEASLSPVVCRRLVELLRTEQDTLVWRFAMQGVVRDGSTEAARLALLAINSHWPDVRVLGCEYVGRHGQADHAAWLVPLFYDSNKSAQLAAVTAAGMCHNPVVLDGLRPADGQAALRGLRPLLTESQGQLQYAVVAAMSRLGDPQAMQELVRLALDGTSSSRLDVVQTMGATGQTRFVEPLIRLAWTEPNHHLRQAALNSLLKLVPQAEQPKQLAKARNLPEAVEIWTAWWEDRQSRRNPAPGLSVNRQG